MDSSFCMSSVTSVIELLLFRSSSQGMTSVLARRQYQTDISVCTVLSSCSTPISRFCFTCRDGAVARALAPHQCGPGSIPSVLSCQRFRKFRWEIKWKGPFRFLPTGIFGITSGGGPLILVGIFRPKF